MEHWKYTYDKNQPFQMNQIPVLNDTSGVDMVLIK